MTTKSPCDEFKGEDLTELLRTGEGQLGVLLGLQRLGQFVHTSAEAGGSPSTLPT